MDIFAARYIALNKFLQSPSGKGYFVPQSKPRRSTILKKVNNLAELNTSLFSRDYFRYIDRSSPANCRIRKLKPLMKEKSAQIIRKSASPAQSMTHSKKRLNLDSSHIFRIRIKYKSPKY